MNLVARSMIFWDVRVVDCKCFGVNNQWSIVGRNGLYVTRESGRWMNPSKKYNDMFALLWNDTLVLWL